MCNTSGLLKRGTARDWLKRQDPEYVLSIDDLYELIASPGVMGDLDNLYPSWLLSKCVSSKRRNLSYVVRVFKRFGIRGLIEKPKIVVGTIHSVKGGEADVVYLAPDLSYQGFQQLEGRGRDQVFRQFYVGMTRAKETLVLCSAKNGMSVEW